MNIFFREDQARVMSTMSKLEPVWDRERRELRLGDIVVKRYRWPAVNQERVINAFMDEGWPSRIDDPLPASHVNAKAKLHDTIKCLNKNQENKLIKFRGDGTGKGVLLEIIPQNEADSGGSDSGESEPVAGPNAPSPAPLQEANKIEEKYEQQPPSN